MIYGIGTDICDIRRIESALQRHGIRFVRRILGSFELEAYGARTQRCKQRGLRYLATRFSAKESLSKAVGLGLHYPMTWKNCEILNDQSGKPHVVLHGDLLQWFNNNKLQAHITLSDEANYAASFCVVEHDNS